MDQSEQLALSCIFSQDGFVKFSWKFGGEKTLSDLDHCRVVLRALAHFHAYSTVIQVRLAGQLSQISDLTTKYSERQ